VLDALDERPDDRIDFALEPGAAEHAVVADALLDVVFAFLRNAGVGT
jgi:hypothetical protein